MVGSKWCKRVGISLLWNEQIQCQALCSLAISFELAVRVCGEMNAVIVRYGNGNGDGSTYGDTMLLHGILGWTIMFHGIQWYAMVYHGIPWTVPWYIMVSMGYHGIPWDTMVKHGMSWNILLVALLYHDVTWYNMVHNSITSYMILYLLYHGAPCYTMVRPCYSHDHAWFILGLKWC